jgi:hypothetical protein
MGLYEEGEDLSGLVFHTFIVDKNNMNGPCVDIHWEGTALVATYTEKSEWVTLADAAKGWFVNESPDTGGGDEE